MSKKNVSKKSTQNKMSATRWVPTIGDRVRVDCKGAPEMIVNRADRLCECKWWDSTCQAFRSDSFNPGVLIKADI